MNVHKNARLTPNGRIHLIELIDSVGLKAAAAATGLSSRTAAKWQDREAGEGVAGLVDRSSRSQRVRAPITAAKRERIVRLRQRRSTMRTIAVRVGVSMATVSRVLAEAGCSRLPLRGSAAARPAAAGQGPFLPGPRARSTAAPRPTRWPQATTASLPRRLHTGAFDA